MSTDEHGAAMDGRGREATGDPVVLTERQQALRAMAGQASELPPVPTVEEMRELSVRLEMAVPERFKRPEYMYHWKDQSSVAQELVSNGGIWQVVTRTNHSHIPTGFFHAAMGAVIYKDTVLCFARKEWEEFARKETARALNMRMDAQQAEQTYKQNGQEMARLTMLDEGELRRLGRGYGATPDQPGMEIEDTADVDFEEV